MKEPELKHPCTLAEFNAWREAYATWIAALDAVEVELDPEPCGSYQDEPGY